MIERLYYVFVIIKEATKPISANNIKEKLLDYNIKVDIKTVYQCIKNINELFELLAGKQLIQTLHKRGYLIVNDYFDDGKLQYLIDSISFNNNLNNKEANELINQLKDLSSQLQLDRLSINQDNHQELNYDLLLHLTNIIKAINEHNNIYFKYVSYHLNKDKLEENYHSNGNYKGDNTYYVVSPYRIVLRDSKYYLIGYFDQRKDKLSIYRLDRMRTVRSHSSPYIDITDQFDLDKEFDNNINMYISGFRDDLEIKFDEAILREVVNQFGNNHVVRKTFDNQYLMKVEDILISDGLIGWLMMLQDKIEVIMPLSLKDEMKTRIEKMHNKYK